jgi:hypothetical protein
LILSKFFYKFLLKQQAAVIQWTEKEALPAATAAIKSGSNLAKEHPKTTTIVGAMATGAVIAPLLAPVVIGAAGFSAAGPVAGSLAAGMQSSIGLVAAGSPFAIVQSAAMGGSAASAIVGTVASLTGLGTGGAVGGAAVAMKNWFRGRPE